MAGRTLISFAIVALTCSLSVSACIWPWCTWEKCNYTEVQGAHCKDCNTQAICTKIGQMVRPCLWPGKSNCVNGICQAQPSAECVPTSEPPTEPSEPTEQASEPATEPTETPEESNAGGESKQGGQDNWQQSGQQGDPQSVQGNELQGEPGNGPQRPQDGQDNGLQGSEGPQGEQGNEPQEPDNGELEPDNEPQPEDNKEPAAPEEPEEAN